MTTNAGIQSVFARAILDVHFLDAIAAKENILLPSQNELIPLPSESLQSLRHFSAFIAKVQHNYLWNDFPLTLTCIRRGSIELEIFGAYLPAHQQNRKIKPALTIDEKKDRFVSFFKSYTKTNKEPAYIKAHTIITHEEIYRQAKKNAALSPSLKLPKKRPDKDIIPIINGRIWLAALNINPADISNPLLKDDQVKLYQRKKRYCYWQPSMQEELRVFEVSKNMAAVLDAIDGTKKINELKALNGYTAKAAAKGYKAILEALNAAGIVSYI